MSRLRNRTVMFMALTVVSTLLIVACGAAAAEAPTHRRSSRSTEDQTKVARRRQHHRDLKVFWIARTNGKLWLNRAFLDDEIARLAEERRQAELARQREREEARRRAEGQRSRSRRPSYSSRATYGSGACGGNLPSCSIMMCESGGNIHAENPSSSASGKWQIVQSTANAAARAIGRPDLVGSPASSWPESVQDQAAAWIWNGGAGRGQWSC